MTGNKTNVKGFFLYFDQYEIIKALSNDQKAKLLDALFVSLAGGECDIEDAEVSMAFKFIKLSHEQRVAKYSARSEKARENVSKRWAKQSADTNVYETYERIQNIQTYTNDTNVYEDNVRIGSYTNDTNAYEENVRIGSYTNDTITITKNNNKEQKQEQNIYMGQDAPTARAKRFTPPTVDDVRAYCMEKKFNVNAEYFVNYYEGRGWVMSGNVKMKNWKATLAQWNARERKQSGQGTLIPQRQSSPGQFDMNRQRDIANEILAELEAEDALRFNAG